MKHIKKLIALAVVAATVLAVAVPAMAATTGKYNTAAVFLRPAVDSSNYLGKVNKGTTCDILNTSFGSNGRKWYQVKITSNTTNDGINLNGKTGWSWAEFIDVTGGTTPSERPQTMTEAFGTATLRQGSRGNYVKNVQALMYWHSFGWIFDDDVDGIYGPLTFDAVWEFQDKYWYELADTYDQAVDGIVGPKTKALLWQKYGHELKQWGYK